MNISIHKSKSTTVRDFSSLAGLSVSTSDFVEFFNNLLSFNDFTENNMLSVKPGALNECDEELRSVGVGTSVGHWEKVRLVMFEFEVFIFKLVSINGLASGTISVCEVSSLSHEISDDSMERWSLVSKSFLSGTESFEVGSSLGDNTIKQFEDDSASWGGSDFDVKENFRHLWWIRNIQIIFK